MHTEKLNIVMAGDDNDERQLLNSIFKDIKLPHMLTVCRRGNELLKYIETGEPLPHLVLLEMSLPEADAIYSLKQIRSHPKSNQMSVAVYTDNPNNISYKDAYTAGANIYIEKPASNKLLKKIINEIVKINWQYITDGLDREKFIMKF